MLTIREQILLNWQAKLGTIRTENGYNLDLGKEVLRSFLPPIDWAYLPSVGFSPGIEENVNLHGGHEKFLMQIPTQGIAEFGTISPGEMVELIYADIVEAIKGPVWSLGFDSGGPYKATVGATISGATSGATGYIAGVNLSSGAWADENAAGTFALRRLIPGSGGEFQNNEQLDIGSNDDVATVDGALTVQGPLTTTTGGLADSIDIISAEPQIPNQDQKSTGINVVFGVTYKRVAGDPYSQTN